jgi:Helix-turn-helix.
MIDHTTLPDNPIARYMKDAGIHTVTELAARLETSKGNASDIINGRRPVGVKVARRMAKLTGRPWHEFVTEASDS